jgi:hypothetical protein
VRRSAIDAVGGFDPSFRQLEDWDLALRLALLGGAWAFISEPLVTWNPGSDLSLTAVGLGDPIRLCENSVRLLDNILASLNGSEQSKIKRLLESKLRTSQRELESLRALRTPSSSRRAWVTLLSYVERSRRFLYRRSPMFPRMLTSPLSD